MPIHYVPSCSSFHHGTLSIMSQLTSWYTIHHVPASTMPPCHHHNPPWWWMVDSTIPHTGNIFNRVSNNIGMHEFNSAYLAMNKPRSAVAVLLPSSASARPDAGPYKDGGKPWRRLEADGRQTTRPLAKNEIGPNYLADVGPATFWMATDVGLTCCRAHFFARVVLCMDKLISLLLV